MLKNKDAKQRLLYFELYLQLLQLPSIVRGKDLTNYLASYDRSMIITKETISNDNSKEDKYTFNYSLCKIKSISICQKQTTKIITIKAYNGILETDNIYTYKINDDCLIMKEQYFKKDFEGPYKEEISRYKNETLVTTERYWYGNLEKRIIYQTNNSNYAKETNFANTRQYIGVETKSQFDKKYKHALSLTKKRGNNNGKH